MFSVLGGGKGNFHPTNPPIFIAMSRTSLYGVQSLQYISLCGIVEWPFQSFCLPHDLFIAKIQAYGFDARALSLMKDHLSNLMQRNDR